MKISEYLKRCRDRLGLTQEALSHELYLFDLERFAGVDTTTISKWERGVSAPPLPRLKSLLRYFQAKSALPFPCAEERGEEEAFERFYNAEVSKVIGRPREIVGRAPLDIDFDRGFTLRSLRGHPRSDELLELASMMIEANNPEFSSVSVESLREWMEYPANLFQVVAYKSSFLGLLFTLRLTPHAFEEIMAFRRPKAALSPADFATEAEEGCLFALAFFSLTPQVATLLMARLYAHLLAHQRHIEAFGFLAASDDARLIAEKMELKAVGRRQFGSTALSAYRSDLFSLFTSEAVLKSLFDKASAL